MLKDKMIAKGAKYIQSIYQDPFIQGIIKGRLDHDVICHYLQADNIYLGKFADIYALCLAKSDNLRDKQFFLEQIDFTLNRELADGEGPHQALAAYTNRSYQDIIEKGVWYPSADHYIKHMYFHFYENGIAGALAAMSPCPWIYHQLAKKIIEENQFLNGNPFNNWITFYANDTVEELMENYFRKKNGRINMTYLAPVLTIAGTDPSGGAGIMADLKTFQARRTYGMAVVTSVVAQNTCGVRGVQHIETAIIDQQLACVYDDIKPKAVKTGMLAERETISLVASYLKKYPQPYVLDPVMVATSGHRLIDSDAVEALKEDLLPLATIITPNLPEAEVLVGYDLSDEVSIIKAGYDIQKQYSVRNVLIKGGHLDGLAKDYLFLEKEGLITLSNQRINTIHTHGTGCTFAAVVAAELAKGQSILNAVSTAKSFITSAIETAPELGLGNGPVNHTSYQGD